MSTRIYNGNYAVYVHINNINGKVYVGITCRSVEDRWMHGYGYKNQLYFYRAIKKYGWNNFEHFIFAEHLTAQEASNMEIIIIKKLKANNRKYGYNIAQGGLIECCEKDPTYEKRLTEKIKRRISAAVSGKNHPCYGKHLSEKTKRRISESEKGRKKAPNAGTQPIPIVCVETGVVYPSTAEASRVIGVDHSSITMVLKGRRQRAGGFHWKYFNNKE